MAISVTGPILNFGGGSPGSMSIGTTSKRSMIGGSIGKTLKHDVQCAIVKSLRNRRSRSANGHLCGGLVIGSNWVSVTSHVMPGAKPVRNFDSLTGGGSVGTTWVKLVLTKVGGPTGPMLAVSSRWQP